MFIIRVRGEIDRSRPSNNSSNGSHASKLSGFDLYKSWGSVNMLHVYVFFHCIHRIIKIIITKIIKSTRVEVEHYEF